MKNKPARNLEPESVLSVDVENIDSAVLRRLVREVRLDKKQGNPHYYNRIHNRHNRS